MIQNGQYSNENADGITVFTTTYLKAGKKESKNDDKGLLFSSTQGTRKQKTNKNQKPKNYTLTQTTTKKTEKT